MFLVAGDVLEHDDGIVDHEAGGDGERHQRQIVDAVTQQVHGAKVPMMEVGTATRGIKVARNSRRNTNTTSTTSSHGDEQRALDVRHRGANGLGLIETDAHDDGGIDAGVQLRQRRLDRIHGGDDVGAGLPENDEQRGALAVGQSHGPDGLHPSWTFATLDSITGWPLL
jgi:hypothetical protein